MQQVNLGMIGGGTVGSGVFHALQLNGGLMSLRIGVKIRLAKVAVKAFDEPRPYAIPASLMTHLHSERATRIYSVRMLCKS